MSAITNIFSGRSGGPNRARRRCVRLGLVAAVFGSVAFAGASAQAATYTVGSPLTAPFTSGSLGFVGTLANVSFSESGATAVSPVTGTIVRWRVTGASGGPFELRVLTPDGGSTYTGAGTSSPETPTSTATQTFSTDMPISAGQLIGLNNTNATDQIGFDAAATGMWIGWTPPLADGATMADGGSFAGELGFNADVVPEPGVGSLAPSSGTAFGGTTVTITGHDLSGATAVSFGGVPAGSFTVQSDTSITAVSPAAPAGAVDDVTVTTPGGHSPTSAGDRFTYLPKPVVTSVSPSRGPRTGGTSVMITGSGFSGATAVAFGGVPARGFGVVSGTLITAVSPAAPAGTVAVTVTAAGGQSASTTADRFTFNQLCVVPKLKGKKLKAAKKALKKAHCQLGKVRPKGQKKGKVKRQYRKVGSVLPAGSKVNIKLS